MFYERGQFHTAAPNPVRQGRPRELNPGAGVDLLLSVQWQMIGILADQHLGQQVRRRNALVDDMRRNRLLDHRLAVLAGPLAADVAFDGEATRLVIQLLAHIFADAGQLATAGAGRGLGLVTDLRARQLRR